MTYPAAAACTDISRIPYIAMTSSPDPSAQDTTLFASLLAARRWHGAEKIALEDLEGQKISYGRLVLASLVLGRRLCLGSRRGEAIGILLPNVAGLVITLFGLNAFGRVVAILNDRNGAAVVGWDVGR